jgi:hypothetical protein
VSSKEKGASKILAPFGFIAKKMVAVQEVRSLRNLGVAAVNMNQEREYSGS